MVEKYQNLSLYGVSLSAYLNFKNFMLFVYNEIVSQVCLIYKICLFLAANTINSI